jgi:hypothetical protein
MHEAPGLPVCRVRVAMPSTRGLKKNFPSGQITKRFDFYLANKNMLLWLHCYMTTLWTRCNTQTQSELKRSSVCRVWRKIFSSWRASTSLGLIALTLSFIDRRPAAGNAKGMADKRRTSLSPPAQSSQRPISRRINLSGPGPDPQSAGPEKRRVDLSPPDPNSVRQWMTMRVMKQPQATQTAADLLLDNAINMLACGMCGEGPRARTRMMRKPVVPMSAKIRFSPQRSDISPDSTSSSLYSEASRERFIQENRNQARMKTLRSLPEGTEILPFDMRGQRDPERRRSADTTSGTQHSAHDARPSPFVWHDQNTKWPQPGALFTEEPGRPRERKVIRQEQSWEHGGENEQSIESLRQQSSVNLETSQSSSPPPGSLNPADHMNLNLTIINLQILDEATSITAASPLTINSTASRSTSPKTYTSVLQAISNGVWR